MLRKVGVRYAFVEDCPCGTCDEFFAFGRDRDGAVWIAFSRDGVPQRLRGAEERVAVEAISDDELLVTVAVVENVLAESDTE